MYKLLSVLLLALPYGCGSSLSSNATPVNSASVTQGASSKTVHNDPDSIIHHCGRPDHMSDGSAFQPGNEPGAPILSRSLTYSKAHLQLTYISADSSGKNWDLSGLIDTQTNQALDSTDTQATLAKRLPCVVAVSEESGNKSQQAGVGSRKSEDKNERPEGRRG